MTRKMREFVEIAERSSLDAMIDTLVALRDSLPADSEPTVRIQGDEIFGRRLSISYLRPQTAEEAACDARYGAEPEPPVALVASHELQSGNEERVDLAA